MANDKSIDKLHDMENTINGVLETADREHVNEDLVDLAIQWFLEYSLSCPAQVDIDFTILDKVLRVVLVY